MKEGLVCSARNCFEVLGLFKNGAEETISVSSGVLHALLVRGWFATLAPEGRVCEQAANLFPERLQFSRTREVLFANEKPSAVSDIGFVFEPAFFAARRMRSAVFGERFPVFQRVFANYISSELFWETGNLFGREKTSK